MSVPTPIILYIRLKLSKHLFYPKKYFEIRVLGGHSGDLRSGHEVNFSFLTLGQKYFFHDNLQFMLIPNMYKFFVLSVSFIA